MLRTILVVLAVFFYLLFTLPVLLFFKLTNKNHLERNYRITSKMVRFIFRIILFLSGVTVTVKGEENIPEDEAVLFIANHRSYFDIITSYTTLNREIGFIAKIEFLKIPLLKDWMRMTGSLFLDREDMRQGLQVILDGADMVKNGRDMWIFPEGTRNHEAELLEFKEGSLKIAEKADSAVVPVAIRGADEILELHFPFIKAKHVTIEYGTPVYPKRIDRREKKGLGAKMRTEIQTMLDEME